MMASITLKKKHCFKFWYNAISYNSFGFFKSLLKGKKFNDPAGKIFSKCFKGVRIKRFKGVTNCPESIQKSAILSIKQGSHTNSYVLVLFYTNQVLAKVRVVKNVTFERIILTHKKTNTCTIKSIVWIQLIILMQKTDWQRLWRLFLVSLAFLQIDSFLRKLCFSSQMADIFSEQRVSSIMSRETSK